MDGVILLIILIPLIYFILLVVILSKSSANQQTLESLKHKLSQLKNQLSDIEVQLKDLKTERDIRHKGDIRKEPELVKPETRTQTAGAPKEQIPPTIIEKQATQPDEKIILPDVEKQVGGTGSLAEPVKMIEGEQSHVIKEETTDDKKDWEKFIGENLANKIGIAVLVLGISFFVKFAIDKNWINETGRVTIGLVSGGILISLAHYIRNSYRSFSSVLVGGGLTVFYFTIAFAFHQYHLINQQTAFVIMVIITAFAVMLSIFYDRIELAVLASIGGFITPFLVSTGQNNYIALFTYLCILNSGLLVLSWFKRWKAINVISLFFTTIIYGSWFISQLSNIYEPFPYRWSLLFASLFFILFTAMTIVNNLKLKIKFGAFDFILLLTINFLYYAVGVIILGYWDTGDHKGLFTALLGIANLFLAIIFFKQKTVDRNFVQLLIGLTLTFISLTGPVQLKGNHITLFWAAEAVLLFWLYQRTRIMQLKVAALAIVLPLLISLFMDWAAVYSNFSDLLPVIVNRGFVTAVVTATGLFIYYQMMRHEADNLYVPALANQDVRNFLLTAGIILTYAAGALEIYFQFRTRLQGTYIHASYLQLYSFAFIIVLLLFFKKSRSYILLKFLLTAAGMALYVYNLHINYTISLQMLSDNEYKPHFISHWLSAVLLGWLLYDMIRSFLQQEKIRKDYAIPFTWALSACLVFLLSVEMQHVIIWATYSNVENRIYWENLYYKAGLSILWGLSSFTMMWLGMRHSFKTLRIISLTLFTITIIKLFIYDISNIPPGGKIAAFILLGVLLLIVSFMYQRLKKIIIDDAGKEQ